MRFPNLRFRALLFALPLLLGALTMRAQQTLRIAAAADLSPVLPHLAETYEQQTGVHLLASFASSATLAEQIRNGAPFDLYLSADTEHPQRLVQQGLSASPAPVPYARGALVLWARKDSPAQPLSLAALTSPRVQKIALANPAHAPYGLAAQQFLQHEQLWDKLQSRLATAENIAQAAQFVETGNAQLGLISLTTASTPHFRELGSYIVVPADAYAPLIQSGIVVKRSPNASAAEAFLRWLTSPTTQQQLERFGLMPAR